LKRADASGGGRSGSVGEEARERKWRRGVC